MTYGEQVSEVKRIISTNWGIMWRKEDHYFRARYSEQVYSGDVLCDVHGAAQLICNPKVANIYKSNRKLAGGANLACRLCQPSHREAYAAADDGWDFVCSLNRKLPVPAEVPRDQKILQQAWHRRHNWVWMHSEKGSLNLHYLLGMFGITHGITNDEQRGIALLKADLDACIKWAKQNEEFLENN